MTRRETVRQAGRALLARPVRTFLSVAAAALGTLATVLVLVLSTSSSAKVNEVFDELAQTEVRISSRVHDAAEATISWDAAAEIAKLPGVVEAVAMASSEQDAVVYLPGGGGDVVSATSGVTMVSGGYRSALEIEVSAGRAFDAGHVDRGDRVAVVGVAAARRMGITGVGMQALTIGGDRFAVIGIASSTPRDPSLLDGVLVPWTSITDSSRPAPREVFARTDVGAAQAIGEVAALVVAPRNVEGVEVLIPPSPDRLRAAVNETADLLVLALAIGTSLIGGLSIAQASLASVRARTSEFALRRALGSTRGTVGLQVVAEGLMLGLLAGAAGATVGLLAAVCVCRVANWTPIFSFSWLVAVALGSAALGGMMSLFAGYRASRVDPAIAIRAA